MPILQWSMSAIQDVTYSGGVKNAEFMAALGTLIGNLTHWSIETTDLDANGGAYVLKPANASAYPNQRIIIWNSATGIPADRTSKFAYPYSAIGLNDSANKVMVGYCRDASGGAYTAWDSTNPLGVADAANWWKYQIATDKLTSVQIDHMYVIENADGIAFFFNATATSNWWGSVTGKLMEDIDGAPLGLNITSGSLVIGSSFWGSDNDFMDGVSASANGPSAYSWKGTAPDMITRVANRAIAAPELTTASGTRVHIPMYYRTVSVPKAFLGKLRQIRMGQDVLNRTQISNGGGVIQSFLFAPTLGSVADSLAFDQG